MSATPEQIADLCDRLRSHAANASVISRQSIDMDAAAAVISAQVEEIARLEAAAGEVWDEAYAEGAGDTAGWEKETAHAVLKWLDKEGDGFDIHHPDGNTTDAIIQGLYDAKRIGNMAELRAQAERVRVLEAEVARLSQWEWLNDWDDPEYGSWDSIGGAADDIDMEDVRRVTASRIVADLWIAHRCLTVDDEGDPDETEAVAFKTAEEAERCWPESLATARAALNATGEA